MPRPNPLEEAEHISAEEEARADVKQFFDSLSASEYQRMYLFFAEDVPRQRRITKAAATNK